MKIVKQIVFGLAVAGMLSAQAPTPEPAKPEPPQLKRVFVLKYADARHIADVLSVFGYGIKADRDMHVVAVSAPADVMTAVEDAVNRLDVPAAAPRDIDLVVYMVAASEQPAVAGGLPPELQPVADELKKIFSYKGYRLLDSIMLRTQPGNRAEARGVIAPPPPGWDTPYDFSVQPSVVTEDPKGRLIRLDNLRLHLRPQGKADADIQTEITVREGQKVVVGKSNIGTDQALILVVTAKVTE